MPLPLVLGGRTSDFYCPDLVNNFLALVGPSGPSALSRSYLLADDRPRTRAETHRARH